MAQKRKSKNPPQRQEAAAQTAAWSDAPRTPPSLTPDPPRPHFWLLMASGAALAAWLLFLLAMALRG